MNFIRNFIRERQRRKRNAVLSSGHPCFMEMTGVDFDLPDEMFRTHIQSLKHSRCAEIFHRNLKERVGIEAVASYVRGNLKYVQQLCVELYIKDSGTSEQILENLPYQQWLSRRHPSFQPIMESLLDALREDNNKALTDVATLWDMQQDNDAKGGEAIYIWMKVLSYMRCYKDELLGGTAGKISKAFAEHFPSYVHLVCYSHSLERAPLAHNHLYLFMTPQDLEQAEAAGDIERMKQLAYEIVKAEDVYGYMPYDEYKPQITSRRKLTSMKIFYASRG